MAIQNVTDHPLLVGRNEDECSCEAPERSCGAPRNPHLRVGIRGAGGFCVAQTSWSKPGFEDFDLAPRLDKLDVALAKLLVPLSLHADYDIVPRM